MLRKKVKDILENSAGKKICIVGDVMLDLYMLGNVTRISPEAPVQVFDLKNSEPKLGGAANVSLNVKTLGAEPVLIGVIGDDSEGETLKHVMRRQGQYTGALVTEPERPTTCKTRVIADSHHLIRIDSESKKDITKTTETAILRNLSEHADEISILILQDYNKGVLTKNLIRKICLICDKNNIKILVDPKFDNFFEYKNVFIFKPNRKELEDAFGRKSKSDEELMNICNELFRKISCKNLVLTLGEHGMKLISRHGKSLKVESIKTRARKVADVSGAGDTVISTIAVSLAGGSSMLEAVQISNIAAGLVVEEVGIVPINKNRLLSNLI